MEKVEVGQVVWLISDVWENVLFPYSVTLAEITGNQYIGEEPERVCFSPEYAYETENEALDAYIAHAEKVSSYWSKERIKALGKRYETLTEYADAMGIPYVKI